MRRKRRSNGLWFPVIGTTGSDAGDVNYRTSSLEYQTGTAFGGGASIQQSVVVVNGLTFDKSVEPEETGGQYDLQALIGNAYFLKRIVGKLSLLPFSDADAGAPAFVKVGAAFFVARQTENPADVSTANLPVGWQEAVGFPGMNYDCLAAHCANDPWIWRRTWILPNVGQTAADRWTAGPVSNTAFGSVLDGGHIDAKTKRVVKQDERLWFTTSIQPWPFVTSNRNYTYTGISAFVMVDLDYRIFAQPIRSRKSGSF